LSFIYTDREGTGPLTRRVLERLATLLPPRERAENVAEHASLTLADVGLYATPLFSLRTAVVHEDVPRVFLAPLLEASRALRESE
jgi:hypothetical protein